MRVTRVLKALAVVAIMGSFFVSVPRVEAATGTVKIVSVKSVKATQGSDSDEIYFRFSNGQRFPQDPRDIKRGGYWEPNFVFGFENRLVLKLYEADTIGDDDLIGVVTISSTDAPGRRTELMIGDASRYVVVLDVNGSARTQAKPGPNRQQSVPSWAHPQARACRVYKGPSLSGPNHAILGNSGVAYVGQDWDEQISSFKIYQGCQLQAFIHPEFRGPNIIFQGNNNVPPNWVGQISSLKCSCRQ